MPGGFEPTEIGCCKAYLGTLSRLFGRAELLLRHQIWAVEHHRPIGHERQRPFLKKTSRCLPALTKTSLRHMDEIWQRKWVIAHSAVLARSYRQFTKRDLLPGLFNALGLSRNLFDAPFVLVSHGTETDPIFNYGNQAALKLWEMTWGELTRTPCRLTAEAPERDERARLPRPG